MPTGSRDPGVLLDWILDSMGLVRRSSGDEKGALHLIMMEAFLTNPLGGWDSKQLGDQTGLSNTGIHHQMTKLRECGIVSTQVDGKWNRYVLRGGSISKATRLVESEASTILELRLSELSDIVVPSDSRMSTDPEGDEEPFSIRICEPGPNEDYLDVIGALAQDLGLSGESNREGDTISRDILSELSSAHQAMTLVALSERVSESRGRVSTCVERMRSAGLVERVPMVSRISQDVFAGLVRQFDARGEDWLMTRGGLGRLDEEISSALIEGTRNGSLDIQSVSEILSAVDLPDQRILLNTLGGRMPFGFRVSGKDWKGVSQNVLSRAQRTLTRIRRVALRLEESLI